MRGELLEVLIIYVSEELSKLDGLDSQRPLTGYPDGDILDKRSNLTPWE